MNTVQKELILRPRKRGFHLITDEILGQISEIKDFNVGILSLHLKHTSASLSINECADPEVRSDMEQYFNHIIPENTPYFEHTYEGADDMPAHIKSTLIGTSITLPITNGKVNLGTWQGIYLGEHRDLGGTRRIIVTIMG